MPRSGLGRETCSVLLRFPEGSGLRVLALRRRA